MRTLLFCLTFILFCETSLAITRCEASIILLNVKSTSDFDPGVHPSEIGDFVIFAGQMGYSNLARKLNAKYVSFLKESGDFKIEPYFSIEDNRKISGVYVVYFSNGLKAIYKPINDPELLKTASDYKVNPNAELAAFEFSETLGIHIVPVTILRDLGLGQGSLQLFVNGKNKFDSPYRNLHEFWTITIFDALINNIDRNANNSLYFENAIAAIDHGLSFLSDADAAGLSKYAFPISKLNLIGQESILNGLRYNLTEQKIREILSKNFPEMVINEVLQRRSLILKRAQN